MTGRDTGSLPYRPCVGIVLTDGHGQVFAAERSDFPGAWQMPQGGVDPGEDLLDAALRELAEETSVPADQVTVLARTPDWLSYDFPPALQQKRWGGKYRGQKQHWYLMRLDGSEDLIDLDTEHPEFSHWKWMQPKDLLAAIVAFKRPIYAEVFSAFVLSGSGTSVE